MLIPLLLVYKPTVLAKNENIQIFCFLLHYASHTTLAYECVFVLACWCLICLCLFISTNARFCNSASSVCRCDVIYVFRWVWIVISKFTFFNYAWSNTFCYVIYGTTNIDCQAHSTHRMEREIQNKLTYSGMLCSLGSWNIMWWNFVLRKIVQI